MLGSRHLHLVPNAFVTPRGDPSPVSSRAASWHSPCCSQTPRVGGAAQSGLRCPASPPRLLLGPTPQRASVPQSSSSPNFSTVAESARHSRPSRASLRAQLSGVEQSRGRAAATTSSSGPLRPPDLTLCPHQHSVPAPGPRGPRHPLPVSVSLAPQLPHRVGSCGSVPQRPAHVARHAAVRFARAVALSALPPFLRPRVLPRLRRPRLVRPLPPSTVT